MYCPDIDFSEPVYYNTFYDICKIYIAYIHDIKFTYRRHTTVYISYDYYRIFITSPSTGMSPVPQSYCSAISRT